MADTRTEEPQLEVEQASTGTSEQAAEAKPQLNSIANPRRVRWNVKS